MPIPWSTSPDTAGSGDLDAFLIGSESVAAALVSRDGTVLEINRAFERVGGFPESINEAVVAGQVVIVADLVAQAQPRWAVAQAGLAGLGNEIVDCKFWAKEHRGHVLLLAEPLRAPVARLNAYLLELNDDLVRARRELTSLNRRLRQLDELKDLLLASATHDLKQPLMALLSYAELLGDEEVSERAAKMALIIARNARRMSGMVDDLLAAATIMTGELTLDRTPTDLVPLVREALDRVRPAAQAGDVALIRRGDSSASAVVDERRVMQIFDNLLSNAVKYSLPGGQVSVECHVDERGTILTVADTGIGVPIAEQGRLFERYFRASSALAHDVGGTGHGLANARALAEAHGGALTCVSEPGTGSTFTLVLPHDSVSQ